MEELKLFLSSAKELREMLEANVAKQQQRITSDPGTLRGSGLWRCLQ